MQPEKRYARNLVFFQSWLIIIFVCIVRAADVRALAASQSEREAELARTVLREGAALRSHSASAKAKSEKQFKLDEQM